MLGVFFLGFGAGRSDSLRKESHKWEKGCRIARSAFQPERLAVFGHGEEASKNNWWAQFAVSSNFSSEALPVELLASLELQEGKGTWRVRYLLRELWFFPFNIYYSWIEEINMAEGKRVFLLFGSKVLVEPPDSFQSYFQLCAVKIFLAECFDFILHIFYFELLDLTTSQ